ncbi:hypothetical protein TWF569_006395 [Orbilia oligospora]|uniref:Uncharacterized protein n=1 Tax=Orbilia oligospora TaxID=2813651 RepID=A0A7C8N4M0_ORBOL|nr:hypothetical protein TWF102_001269 [Orbilia oligospora]KAF3087659.1 hypothetical protein TWF103_001351 [Orbilia oligospora]KAF3110860.1 hypothetical protein TWF706_000334 [Orbilia oligospora]KAF3135509.1 hypothetical protein TWF703_006053 [Orbilia oligospora]KAF3138997.1 hypothetical protein TWF594_006758 [Orbilia oligospora]
MKIIHTTPPPITATILSFPNTVLFFLFLLVALVPSFTLADRGYDDEVVASDPERIVRESAPLWLLPQGTCIPDSAVDKDGVQNNGTDTDLCRLYGSLDTGCPDQAPFDGPYTKSTAFPTYYHFRYCPNVNQIRILYDMYYPKDTGHRHDWEWAVVTFKQNITTDWRWHREQLILQNEGTNSVFPWADIPEAYSEGDNFRNNAGPNGDHPKLYVGKFHHSVHTDPYTSIFSKYKCAFNAAPVYGNWDYRDSDYYFPAQEWLVNGDSIRKDWTWGTSDSPPPAFFSDGGYDICYLRVDATS